MRHPLGGLIAVGGIFVAWQIRADQKGCLLALVWLVLVGCVVATFMAAFASLALAIEGGAWAVLLPLLALPVALFAFKWMEAPTAEGRQVMDRIAGFKHYLGITEEERLDTLHPPEKTPELFEKYLPYAIALDVENRWADKFAGVLAAAAATATAGHSFDDGLVFGAGKHLGRPRRVRVERRLLAQLQHLVGRDLAFVEQQRLGRRRFVRGRRWRRRRRRLVSAAAR